MPMKLAISGASGKTGYRVAEQALKADIEIRQLTRQSSEIPNSLANYERCNFSLNHPSSLLCEHASSA